MLSNSINLNHKFRDDIIFWGQYNSFRDKFNFVAGILWLKNMFIAVVIASYAKILNIILHNGLLFIQFIIIILIIHINQSCLTK